MIKTNKIEWREVELKELGDIGAGGTPSRTKPEYWGGTIPWLKISNLKEFYVTKYDETITENGLKNSSAKIFKKGTILISIFASLGDVAILDIDATTNQAIAGIYNLKENISREYLALYLKSLKEYFQKIGRGVAQSNLNLSILRSTKIKIPFSNGTPDLKEQERIVSLLEKAEKLKERGKKANDLLDEYLKSVFNEMFLKEKEKFKLINLGDIAEISSGDSAPQEDKYFNDGKYNFYRTSDVGLVHINSNLSESRDKFNDLAIKECKLKLFPKNTILFPKSGASTFLNHRVMIKKEGYVSSHLATIIPKNLINPLFLFYILLQIDAKILIGDHSYPSLRISEIAKVKIPLPPLPLQQKFAKIVEHVEKMKENVKKTKTGSEELFNSLMQKAFKGEL